MLIFKRHFDGPSAGPTEASSDLPEAHGPWSLCTPPLGGPGPYVSVIVVKFQFCFFICVSLHQRQ